MPGFPLTVAAATSCFHQAPAVIVSPLPVLILNQSVAGTGSIIGVVGCPFAPVIPLPCVTIRWAMVSTKVLVQQKPLLVMPPPGLGVAPGICQNAQQAPQGFPVLKANQMKVLVT